METSDILMAEAVVRVMKEFRHPLKEKGKEQLFDEFQEELETLLHSPEGTKHVSVTDIPLNEKGNPLLYGDLRDRYMDICHALDVSPVKKGG